MYLPQSAYCFHLSGHCTLPVAVIQGSRKYLCAAEGGGSIFLATALFQLLSFCKVEHTIALQMRAVPPSQKQGSPPVQEEMPEQL